MSRGSSTDRSSGALLLLFAATLACSPAQEPVRRETVGDAPRIVVLAPAAAEMIEGLGLIHRVVGVGDFVEHPESLTRLPRVGSYDAPNLESVLAMDADLVISTAGDAAGTAHRRLRDLGIEVLELDTSTFEGVFTSLRSLGARLDREEEAERLERSIRVSLDAVRDRCAGAPRRRVLFVVGRDPLYVAGPGSHIDRLIGIAGGVNIASDALAPYQMVSLESMLGRMPEVIVDTSDNRPGSLRGRRPGAWARWDFLPAVRDDRVYWIDPERLVIPGLRLAEMAEELATLIHPELHDTVNARGGDAGAP